MNDDKASDLDGVAVRKEMLHTRIGIAERE